MSDYKRAKASLTAAGLSHIVIRKRLYGPAPEDIRLHRQQSRCFKTWQAALHAVLVDGFRPTPLDDDGNPLPFLPDHLPNESYNNA